MQLEIPDPQEQKLKELPVKDQERIKKKLDEIHRKVCNLGIDPNKVIEKRLTGKLYPLLQQRVGDYRLWFKEKKNKDILLLSAIKTKKEAKKHY